jgi:hypothetical protein
VGFLNRIFRRTPIPHELLGCWHGESFGETAEADFRADGRLFYSVLSDQRWQIMKLIYKVDGDMLITDQPSSPRKETTRFTIESNGDLVLEFNGQRSVFRRGAKMAPEL